MYWFLHSPLISLLLICLCKSIIKSKCNIRDSKLLKDEYRVRILLLEKQIVEYQR